MFYVWFDWLCDLNILGSSSEYSFSSAVWSIYNTGKLDGYLFTRNMMKYRFYFD